MSSKSQSQSHPLLERLSDGSLWFHERNSQWEGEAHSLQVDEILHQEQSKYQDVLVFKSKSHGNVLVLDGAIQCVEKDEFSYQEMITHLPMASHPNPVDVLCIGGGDGGVLREMLKHPSVKTATLCDIDEAVPRVSKKYLPHMAAGFDDPRVTVHIGDGFKWLADKKGQYDVIVTDSSDPVGPAGALFEAPYFQLLYEALKPGGHISTQGECIWLHLPLITKVLSTMKSIFPVVDYAYTSIPTYPSGTIGFVLCSKAANDSLRKPLRDVPNCRYYNKKIHQASFVLPAFAQKGVDAAAPSTDAHGKSSSTPKKVLLLGSGFVAQPCAEYILRRSENSLTIASSTLANAQALASSLSRPAEAAVVNVQDESSLDGLVKEHDLVISLIPYIYHVNVIKSAIKFKKNVVTTSYVSDAMKELEPQVKDAGIVVMNEIGLDPGIDHLYAVKTIDDAHKAGGKVTSFISYCGGLPAPSAADNPLGYKFSWSSRGVLLALLNSAKFYQDGQLLSVDGKDLMKHAKPYYINPAFAFVAYPNRDSTSFREKYNIPEAQTVIRGTLRYAGFPQFIKALVDIGFLSEEKKEYLQPGTQAKWADVTKQALGASSNSESELIEKILSLANIPDEAEQARIIQGLRWIGLFSTTESVTPRANLLDTLCATLESKMEYEKGEKDMVMLQHKFEIETKAGKKYTQTSTLLDYGAPYHTGEGPSSMAKLVGVPCGIAVQLVLDGKINTPGVLAPYNRELVDLLIAEVEKEGITMVEKIL